MTKVIATPGMQSNRGGQSVRWWVRVVLFLLALAGIAVYGTAIYLHPYDELGQPLRVETHRQLGLPPCKFMELFQKPCPACGMTTSFSLLMHGDILDSLRANFVGTLLALFGLGAIPWCLEAAIRGRYRGIRKLEPAMLVVVGITTVLMMVRWGLVLLLQR